MSVALSAVHVSHREVRDMVLGTGLIGGMQQSYARLEREVLKAA